MRNRTFFILSVLYLLFAAGTAQEAAQQDSLKTGDPAPTFSLPDLNNNYVFLRDFCGEELRKPWKNKIRHAVVLSFFATWCGPCKQEIPFLEELRDYYDGKPVKFYLIDVGEDRSVVEPFIKKSKLKIPVLLDRYMQTAQRYGAQSIPRLVVIDKDGTIIKLDEGFDDGRLFISEMKQLLDPILFEQATIKTGAN